MSPRLLYRLPPADETTATPPGGGVPASRPGVVAGTAGYMSPAQASGAPVDARSDVFSFGLLLYEMVTGRRAFVGDSSVEVMVAILKAQPTAPRELEPDVPEALERLIFRCRRKDPDRSFQHCSDLKVELQERPAGDGAALTVSPDGRTILYTRLVGEGSDLVLIENFR